MTNNLYENYSLIELKSIIINPTKRHVGNEQNQLFRYR